MVQYQTQAAIRYRAVQHRIPADAAARPKISGILKAGFVLTLVPIYTGGAAEC
jgi:hypothetical protein